MISIALILAVAIWKVSAWSLFALIITAPIDLCIAGLIVGWLMN